MGVNPDGTVTFDNGGQRYTTLPDGSGPTPVEATTPPPNSASPIGDTTAPPDSPNSATSDSTPDTPDTPPASTPPTSEASTPSATPVAASPFANTSPVQPNSTVAPDGTVTSTGNGTVTTVKPDGSTNVGSTLPPPGGGFTSGPGYTDPSDPQQGQQPIGFTHHDLGTTTSSDPNQMVDPKATIGATETVSDMPNTAHVVQPGEALPGTGSGSGPGSGSGSGTGPHKPPTP
jgi:hypothetical protein